MRIEQIVGQNVRAVRDQRDLQQVQLAALMTKTLDKEWSGKTVSVAEKGGRAFTAAEVVALADVLGVTVARLFEPPAGVSPSVREGKTLGRSALVGHADTSPEGLARLTERLLHEVGVIGNLAEEVKRLAHAEQEQADLIRDLLRQHRDGSTDTMTGNDHDCTIWHQS